jgi:hypothetical protein
LRPRLIRPSNHGPYIPNQKFTRGGLRNTAGAQSELVVLAQGDTYEQRLAIADDPQRQRVIMTVYRSVHSCRGLRW